MPMAWNGVDRVRLTWSLSPHSPAEELAALHRWPAPMALALRRLSRTASPLLHLAPRAGAGGGQD